MTLLSNIFDYLKGAKLYVSISILFFVYMVFFDSASIRTHLNLNSDLDKLNSQKQFLQKEIEKDKQELKELYTEEGKERLGREMYYLKHDDEEVFIIEYDTIN